MSITFSGLDGILDTLDEKIDTDKIEGVLQQACLIVERDAKQNAPKKTGELQRSITSKVESGGGEIKGIVFTPLEYAPYVEYGTGLFAEEGGRTDVPWMYKDDRGEWHSTSGQKPQPFLRPALEDNREMIARLIKEGITK